MAFRFCLSIFFVVSLIFCTPLDDYVKKFDPHYHFEVLNWTFKGDGFTMYSLNMTSQKWLTENDTSNPIWYHAVNVAIPDQIKVKDTAFLYITLGDNDPNYVPDMSINDDYNWFVSLMAATTGTISAVIRNVPNQPIVFKTDPQQQKRFEDAILAFSWRTFLTTKINEPEWLVLLPMTKAAVRALDTLNTFGKRFETNLDKFFVCGESKRGWTTWLTAAVDKRVIGFAPIVFDLLNLRVNIKHHYRSLRGYSWALSDYYEQNLTFFLDTENFRKAAEIIDPYAYRSRYTVPKYIITAGNDEFFLPDDSDYFFNDLPGEKYFRVIPNSNHNLTGHRFSMFLGMEAFYLSILYNCKKPALTWKRIITPNGGKIIFFTDTQPLQINAYHATTLTAIRRDFRGEILSKNDTLVANPVRYFKDIVFTLAKYVYEAEYDNPIFGWTNFFIQATFSGPFGSTYEFTTQSFIIPPTFPLPECAGLQCVGSLV